MRNLKFLVSFTIGVIRDSRVRRQFMFYVVLVAMLLLFAGATFLDTSLRENIWVFAIYWIVCAWLTFAALLLALYDMVAIRSAARRERRRLESEFLKKEQSTLPEDENPA